MREAIEGLKKLDKEIRLLEHSEALLAWDQETCMPEGAIEERSDQLALLTTYIHRLYNDSDMARPLQWMRTQIHRHGVVYPAKELCQRVSGEKMKAAYFMQYLRDKYAKIYVD